MWGDFKISQPDEDFVLLPENGWHALILAVAGPAKGVRCLKRSVPQEVMIHTTVADAVSITKVPFTKWDQEVIDDALDEFISEAGLDVRPRGYDWYLRLPEGVASVEELSSRLNLALNEQKTGMHPAQIRSCFEKEIAGFYEARPGQSRWRLPL